MKELITKAVQQMKGPYTTVSIIEEPRNTKDGVYLISAQKSGKTEIMVANVITIQRGHTIQLFEKVYQSFLPS